MPIAAQSDAAVDAAASGLLAPGGGRDRLEELSEIIGAYNQVTEKLQASHEALRQQVMRLQDELASADARLQRSKRLAALGEMAAGIAHEIRNPLAAIQLYAGLLVEDLPPKTECARTAKQIASGVRRLNAIVGDVLSFSREIGPRRRPTLVAELVSRVIDAHRPAIEQAHVTVHCHSDDPNSVIDVDPDLLHQALLNLVRNAVDAMGDTGGGASGGGGVITIETRLEEGHVVITIRDTGPGIAEADIDRIFNPFFTTRNTGTGLGLAIVHRIVDAHDGSICVSNDGGAVFELILPAMSEPRQRQSVGSTDTPHGSTATDD